MPGRLPCPPGCGCGTHSRRPHPTGCGCRVHDRTLEHNIKIGVGVYRAFEAKRQAVEEDEI